MRLTWRDAVATALTAIVVALYVGYRYDVGLSLVSNPRVLAATAFVLGVVACIVGGRVSPSTQGRAAARSSRWFNFFGTVASIAAIAVLITGSEVLLALLVGVIVALWLAATARHLFLADQSSGHLPVPTSSQLTAGPRAER